MYARAFMAANPDMDYASNAVRYGWVFKHTLDYISEHGLDSDSPPEAIRYRKRARRSRSPNMVY